MTHTSPSACIGVLHCGDLGSALARLLAQERLQVVTSWEGRSESTRRRAADCGAEILPTLEAVIERSDIIISLVHPNAAVDVAEQCANAAQLAKPSCLYIDANSVDLQSLLAIADVLEGVGMDFVDATIRGGADRLGQIGWMYLSGSRASEAEQVFTRVLRVRCLGDRVGQATRLKLIMSGLAKGLPALFLESALLAHHSEMLDLFLEECQQFYPQIMEVVERTLPTFPQHVDRRIVELDAVERLAQQADSQHAMIAAAGQTLRVSAKGWKSDSHPDIPVDVRGVITTAAEELNGDVERSTKDLQHEYR